MLMEKHNTNSRSLGHNEDYYHSTDIDIASTLICKGYELTDVVLISHNKATFVFRNHPAITDAVDGFWSNRIEVHPLNFTNTRKNLKSRIFGMQKRS